MPDYLQYPSLYKLMLTKAASCTFDHECMCIKNVFVDHVLTMCAYCM